MDHPVLSIDYGDARIGVAATDEFGIAAHPVETVNMKKGDPLARLSELILSRRVKQIVLGLPLRTDGSEGTSAEKVRTFGRKLQARVPDIPLAYFDERYTTVTAADKLRLAGKKAKQQREIIDQAAALEILNDYLGW